MEERYAEMLNDEQLAERREMDKRIAERFLKVKVFRPSEVKDARSESGWSSDYHYIPSGKPPRTHMIDAVFLPRFSTHYEPAIQLVQAMKEMWHRKEGYVEMFWVLTDWREGGWYVQIKKTSEWEGSTVAAEASAMALPYAICLALEKLPKQPTTRQRTKGTSAAPNV